jgi:cell division protease FtsH
VNNSNKPDDRRPGGGDPDPQFNWRGLILFAVAFALIGGAFIFRGGNMAQIDELTYPKFTTLLAEGKIVSTAERPVELVVEEGRNTQTISGYYRKMVTVPPATEPEERLVEFRTPVFMPFNGEALEKQLAAVGVTPAVRSESNLLATTLIGFLPILLFLVILYFIFRSQLKMAGRGAFNFGKSKARMMARDKNKITFKDVAGVEEAKEEVSELVDFLKDPKKFQKLGGRIPKGVLMVGPPGTGKTLLARAIAGEADVPFFSISGSDFVEMFVGVGASRVRDMFEQGRKSAPCLIFIDEIDAVGRLRGAGLGGGHDEREQTLNQLLVEMDGFDTTEGVILVAATNRPDVLDPALLRPGRFDRQVTVNRPDLRGRTAILKVHTKKVPIATNVELEKIARGTPGFSGADLENLVNEAALWAARQNKTEVEVVDFEMAKDKVLMGAERKSLILSDEEKRTTAYHEAGHALIAKLIPGTDPVHKVTIIPRGRALGVTMQLPTDDRHNYSKEFLYNNLAILMGGRVAEELVLKHITTGAGNDLERATDLARKMVCEWGMSEKLGPLTFGKKEEEVFLGREFGSRRDFSEQIALEIDQEVKRLVTENYERAKRLLTEHMVSLKGLAEALLEKEVLDATDIDQIIMQSTSQTVPA